MRPPEWVIKGVIVNGGTLTSADLRGNLPSTHTHMEGEATQYSREKEGGQIMRREGRGGRHKGEKYSEGRG